MQGKFFSYKTIIVYSLIFSIFFFLTMYAHRIVPTFEKTQANFHYIVLDAGHGGVDGGAVSVTGVYESMINLDIVLKLNDLLHLLGYRTVMIRNTDCSVYTDGQTIAAKKVSDIKERVRIVNNTPNAFFVSIHQNSFQDNRYSGAQVFYNGQTGSKEFAEMLQSSFRQYLDSNNRRQCKRSSEVYLMEHINSAGVLVECGFLSNPAEEQLLKDDKYQNNISCVIATTISQYLNKRTDSI